MIRDTSTIVVVSSLIAVFIGGVLAWINERTDAGMGTLADALPLVPLFLPAVALAVGWVILASPKVGLLSPILEPLGLQIYSGAGLTLVYVLLAVPYTYLPVVSALRSLDPSLEDAARMSGASTLRVLRTISLPAVAPALLSGFVLAVIVGAGVYSLPAIVGQGTEIDIMSVRIVRSIQNTYPVDYGTALRLSTILFLVLFVLYVLQRGMVANQRFARVGGQAARVSRIRLGKWRWPVRALSIAYIFLAAVLPMAAIIIVSFQRYWQPDLFADNWTLKNYTEAISGTYGAFLALKNSVLVGLVASAAIVLVTMLILTYVRHSKSFVGRLATAASRMPAAVPNSVLAVAFIFALGGPPFNLAGTLLIMGLAYFVIFLPYAAISLESSSAQIDRSLEDASYLCGASKSRTFVRVFIPLLRPGLLATFALVFVRIVGDLAVAVLLGTGQTPLVSALLFEVWAEGFFTQVAVVSLMMTVVTATIVIVLLWLSKPAWVRRVSSARKRAAGTKRA
jgi:iron(III) transport system permease protein